MKIKQNKNSKTQYITVPAYMVVDTNYPFLPNEEVIVEIISKEEGLIIRKIEHNEEGEGVENVYY